jgi:alkanesulfonate monooxygenase SsuD/methylene tetrahydromethanopterin reductase-like flavin-dependent oxidoreductase (luciferase family)
MEPPHGRTERAGPRRPCLGVALDGAGSHPAAWRHPGARPAELFSAGYYVELARTADRGGFDLVTLDDAFAPPSIRADEARGRFDAVQLAARIAPATERIGVVPVALTTHTEPFHISKQLATLDFVSGGRAGWQPQVCPSAAENDRFGRAPLASPADLHDEARDVIDVVVALWDSWEDGAEIRDAATGRFLDNTKLHYVDFEGRFFSVRGPSITPRPPQGHLPIVIALDDDARALAAAAEWADVVRIRAGNEALAVTLREQVRDAVAGAGRDPDTVRVLVDAVVTLADTEDEARSVADRLDGLAGRPYRPDTLSFTGAGAGFADVVEQWFRGGAADGFLVRPAVLPAGLDLLVRDTLPALAGRGLLPAAAPAAADTPVTLRSRLGLGSAPNRFTASV